MLCDDKSNTLDSGRIAVQQADSWGKTVVLRDGIDTESKGEAWGHYLSSADAGIDSDSEFGAGKMYVSLVRDQTAKYVVNLS